MRESIDAIYNLIRYFGLRLHLESNELLIDRVLAKSFSLLQESWQQESHRNRSQPHDEFE